MLLRSLIPIIGSHVTTAQQRTIPNDKCDAATKVSPIPFADTVNTTSATADFTDVTCDIVAPTDIGVWYSYTSDTDVILEVVFTDTTFTPRLTAFTGSCDNPICYNIEYPFVASAGVEYRLLVTGVSATTGKFTIEIKASNCTWQCFCRHRF